MKQISLALLMSVAIVGCCKAQTVINQKSGNSIATLTTGAKKICKLMITEEAVRLNNCDFSIPLNNPVIVQDGKTTTLTFEQWVGSISTGTSTNFCTIYPDGTCK